MSTPDVTFGVLDGTEAGADRDELQALHAEVYAGPQHGRDEDAARFADRFRVQRRQPGYVLAEARHGGYLVGYASGYPLRPSTSWWRHLTTALPDEVTAEHPGRTFALSGPAPEDTTGPPGTDFAVPAGLRVLLAGLRPVVTG